MAGAFLFFKKQDPLFSYLNKTFIAAVDSYERIISQQENKIENPRIVDREGFSICQDFNEDLGSFKLVENKEGAYQGYTSVSTISLMSIFLVNIEGKCVYEWFVPLNDDRPIMKKMKELYLSNELKVRKDYIYPNGDILVLFALRNATPWGYVLLKLNKNSEIQWVYDGKAHHDLDVDEEGNIYVLTHEVVDHRQGYWQEVPYIEDYIVKLSPEGKELEKISISKAFMNSKHILVPLKLMDSSEHSTYEIRDYFHNNTVDLITEEIANLHDFLEKGDILLSMRTIDLIAVLRPSQEKIVWVKTGDWRAQHSPEFLPNGNLLIFDNKGNLSVDASSSRILQVNPINNKLEWYYDGYPDNMFYTAFRTSVTMLNNGNFLITSSEDKKLIEVNEDKEILWDLRFVEGDKNINYFIKAERFGIGELKFLED